MSIVTSDSIFQLCYEIYLLFILPNIALNVVCSKIVTVYSAVVISAIAMDISLCDDIYISLNRSTLLWNITHIAVRNVVMIFGHTKIEESEMVMLNMLNYLLKLSRDGVEIL